MKIKTSPHLHLIVHDERMVAYHSLLGNASIIDRDSLSLIEYFKNEIYIQDCKNFAYDSLCCLNDLIRSEFITREDDNVYEIWKNEIEKRARDEPSFSEGIVFLISSDCNLNCSYCIANQDSSFKGTIDFDTIKNVITEYINIRRTRNDENIKPVIAFSGGEPTLHYQIIESVCNFNKVEFPDINFSYRITTNATRLNKKIINLFYNYKFHVVVSLDVNEKNSQRKFKHNNRNSWKRAYSSINLLLKHGCDCSVSSVLQGNETTTELIDFLLLLKKAGIDSLAINYDNNIEMNHPQEKAKAITDLVEYGNKIGIDVGGSWCIPAMELFSKTNRRDRWAFCSAASRVAFFVRPNGKISFCDYYPKIIGNVKNLNNFFENNSGRNPYVFGQFKKCIGCEIEGFCSPCLMETEHLHIGKNNLLDKRCVFLKECFKRLVINHISR